MQIEEINKLIDLYKKYTNEKSIHDEKWNKEECWDGVFSSDYDMSEMYFYKFIKWLKKYDK